MQLTSNRYPIGECLAVGYPRSTQSEAATMLSMEGLSCGPVAGAKLGHLIYVFRDTGPAVAIRLEHPAGSAAGSEPYAVALVLHDEARGRRMPLVDRACRAEMCVDWGVPPTVVWDHPLDLRPRHVVVTPDPGFLLLVGAQPSISSYYAGGRGDRMYWDLKTGQSVEPGQFEFVTIAKWKLGVMDTGGSFVQLAAYPDDYG